jgi:hypothetical protein
MGKEKNTIDTRDSCRKKRSWPGSTSFCRSEMNVPHKRSLVLLAVGVSVCAGLYLARALILQPHPVEDLSEESASVIVIMTTDACQCALERCGEVEEAVHQIVVRLNRDAWFEIIDYAEEPQRANEIMQRFDAYLIPVVLVVDAKGKAVYRSEWDLDERLLATAIESLTAEEE